ncbi:hypothetical protein EDB85DRAFT_1897296 [Lactarius pseudohatsudake]|nr:hypothetical protein EDB85DRAFT_1897296 [Lactarius pseudohatsudake]
MPCMRSTIRQRRRFLPHLPPSSMRCSFSPELVPPLFHAMRGVFQKRLENDSADGSSPPPSPLTRLRLHHSYRSLRGKSAVSVVGGTPLEISSNNSTGGKMDFTKKSGYNLLVCNTAVVLRFFLGKATRSMNKLTLVCEMASKEFPVLLEYEGNWVVHDYLRICLKNRAQKAKKDQQQKDKEPEAKGKARVADHSSWLLLANLPVF